MARLSLKEKLFRETYRAQRRNLRRIDSKVVSETDKVLFEGMFQGLYCFIAKEGWEQEYLDWILEQKEGEEKTA